MQVMYNVLPIEYFGLEEWEDGSHRPYEIFYTPASVRACSPASTIERFYHTVRDLPCPPGLRGDREYDDYDDDTIGHEWHQLNAKLVPLIRQSEIDSGVGPLDRLLCNASVNVDPPNLFDRTDKYLFEDHRVLTERLLVETRRLLAAEFPLWRVAYHHYRAGHCADTEWIVVYPNGILHERETSNLDDFPANEAASGCYDDASVGSWFRGWQNEMEAVYLHEFGDAIAQLRFVREHVLDAAVARSVGKPEIIACFDRASAKDGDAQAAWLLCPQQADLSSNVVFHNDEGEQLRSGVELLGFTVKSDGSLAGTYASDPVFKLWRLYYPGPGQNLFIRAYRDDPRSRQRTDDVLVAVDHPSEVIPMRMLT